MDLRAAAVLGLDAYMEAHRLDAVLFAGRPGASITDQAAGLAAQERDLTAASAERIFGEQISSTAERVKLAECLAFLRDGDMLTAEPKILREAG